MPVRVAVILLVVTAAAQAAPTVIDDFATGRGHFDSPISAGDHTTGFFPATSSIAHDPSEGHNAPGSLKVVIDDDPNVDFRGEDPWRLLLPSASGLPARNVSLPATGFVGYWLKTTASNVNASIVVDDGTGTEQGRLIAVIGDGQWHLYEWDLGVRSTDTQWSNMSGGNAVIDHPTVTLDALQLWTGVGTGKEIDGTFWFDDVGHNPTGSLLPEPCQLAPLAMSALLFSRRRRAKPVVP